MIHNVVLLRRAQSEFDVILAYLTKHSPSGAGRWLSAFDSLIDSLALRPDSYPLAPENGFMGVTVRHAFFKTPRGKQYRVLFYIAGNDVRIMHLLGPGQDLLGPDNF